MDDITIIMPSYNKEDYIAEALDSVFMQETEYSYHIIVADDCSSDKTCEIVREYQERYPHKITLLTSEKNQKLYRNVLRAYAVTKTDYFCVLDPDDYWIDKYKIQKALDFLNANREYTIYATDTLMLMPDGTKKELWKHYSTIDSTFADFLRGKAALGCTLGSVFRNVVFKNGIPDKMKFLEYKTMERSFRGDSFRSALHIYYGKAHLVPECDAVYRVTAEGLWQGISGIEQDVGNARLFKDLWLYFEQKYPELLVRSYKIAKRADTNLVEKLFSIGDDARREGVLMERMDLQVFFEKYQKVIHANLCKGLGYRYQILFGIYERIQKKLLKKGVI